MRRTALLLLLSLLAGTVAAAEKAFRPGELWPDNNGAISTATAAECSSMAARSSGLGNT